MSKKQVFPDGKREHNNVSIDTPSTKLETTRISINRQRIKEHPYQQLLQEICAYFAKHIKNRPQASQYLLDASLAHPQLLDEFQIGYCDNDLLGKLPAKTKDTKDIREYLKELGLLDVSAKLSFEGCLIFPIFDHKHHIGHKQNIIDIYARRIQKRKNKADELYLSEQAQAVFYPKALAHYSQIIVCDSIFNALAFWIHGFVNVIFCYTQKQQQHLFELFQENQEYQPERIYIAYSSCPQKEHQANILAECLGQKKITSLRVEFPVNTDAHDYIRRVRAPQQNINFLLQSARVMQSPKSNLFHNLELLRDNSRSSHAESLLDYQKLRDAHVFVIGERKYSFYGLEKNHSSESLKLRAKIYYQSKLYTDNAVDLFCYKTTQSLIKSAALKLQIGPEIIERDLDSILPKLEELQAEHIENTSIRNKTAKNADINLSEKERQAALDYLKAPDLIEHICNDFEQIGLMGEKSNTLIGYLAASSRKDEQPLAVIIQSSSGAGKTTFMDAVLKLMPEEEYVKYSTLTSQSLYYMQTNLKHRILALVEEEGAQRASYSLKLLQSEGVLSIASAGKDPDTGKMITQNYEVEGPVMIFIATTNFELDPELKNRCVILTVNETSEQTKRILAYQRQMETLQGLLLKSKQTRIYQLHKNVQRVLCPVHVINPYAKSLSFYAKDHRSRRHQKKYLGLMRMIAFLHQYQREKKTIEIQDSLVEYIEVSLKDIELANELSLSIFGVCLDDLSPQTRKFLESIYHFVMRQCRKQKIEQEDFRFTRRDLVNHTNLSPSQVGVYLKRLEKDEYIHRHKGRRGQKNVYELIYKGEGNKNSCAALGLTDIEQLKRKHKQAI